MIAEEMTSRVAPNGSSKRRRVSTNQTVINSDVYMNLEVSSGSLENILIEEVFKQLKCMREGEKASQVLGIYVVPCYVGVLHLAD
ncbi:hypothetical protein RHSIM_Rhsim10G0082500 [Rhododendron simsii]|uniref:Uncharacterized protein n=1 Tax=Rhododendron simsii TaxID=118357 RepID=A0A834GEM8_RHOSS|nr:hypothetical protein RHSIM_Rhsim10G0082500 [Rhododendron simsii]